MWKRYDIGLVAQSSDDSWVLESEFFHYLVIPIPCAARCMRDWNDKAMRECTFEHAAVFFEYDEHLGENDVSPPTEQITDILTYDMGDIALLVALVEKV